jgi:P27 family predicted phage terminase small subunit
MGERGPRRKPSAQKALEGDTRGLNEDEPVPAAQPVEPPAWLVALDVDAHIGEETALDVWHKLAPDMEKTGVLTPWDVDEFAVFCDAVVNHRRASEEVRKYGLLVQGAKGNLVKNPAVQIARDYADLMVKVGARFGLSPSDRVGLKVERGGDDDDGYF